MKKDRYKVLHPWRNRPVWVGEHPDGKDFSRKGLGVLGYTKLNVSQSVPSRQGNTLGCFKASIASRLRWVVLPLHLALLKPILECCVQFWIPQDKRGMDVLEQVQQKITKIINVLEHLSCDERLRELGLFSTEKTRGNPISMTNT